MFAIYSVNVIYNMIRAKTWEEFAAQIINLSHFVSLSCSPTQCRNHWANMTLGCAGLLCDALLVYKATLPIVLMWGSYNHLSTPKFNVARMKPNLHHLFRFVDSSKICNTKAVAIGTVELWSKFKTKWCWELYYIDVRGCHLMIDITK